MYAIVTGASSGIGFEFAKLLSDRGYDIVAVGRNKKKLEELKNMCKTKVEIEVLDLSVLSNCEKLYQKYKNKEVEVLVNNAGIGAIGEFIKIPIEKELEMINLNIVSLHYLTKVFSNKMSKENKGYILNVSSSAAFAPGPLMATYYATKSYVFKFTQAIAKELKKSESNVKISVVCPGPVETQFNKKMNVNYSVKPISASYVAKYSLKELFKGRTIIIPGIKNNLGVFVSKIIPDVILEKYIYSMQSKKIK